MVNKYAGTCTYCGGRVAPSAGVISKSGRMWLVAHLACADKAGPMVVTIKTSGGTFYQNRNGRCEDAPCCGCCTI